MSIARLRQELQQDPLGRGYSGMTVGQIHADINERRYQEPRRHTTPGELLEVIDLDEVLAPKMSLAAAVLGHSTAIDYSNARARGNIAALFAPGSSTRGRLTAFETRPASRAEVLGVPGDPLSIMRAQEG